MKHAYEAPVVTVVGSVEEVTLGGVNGNYLDQTFPAGTFYGDLTFSG
jgi:hypothetical protein